MKSLFKIMNFIYGFFLLSVFASCNRKETVNDLTPDCEVLKGSITSIEIDHNLKLFDAHSLYDNNQLFVNLEIRNTTNNDVSFSHLIGVIDPYVIGFENKIKTLKLNFDSTIQVNSSQSNGTFGLSPWLTIIESSSGKKVIESGGKVQLKCRLLSTLKGLSLSDIISNYQPFFESDFFITSASGKPLFVFSKKSSLKIILKLDHKIISGNNRYLMDKEDNIPDDLP